MSSRLLAVSLLGLMVVAAPASAETYYVLPDQSSVNLDANMTFSVSGYLKLVIFPEDGWLDWLNPKSNAFGGIHAAKNTPSRTTGTFDAAVANNQLTVSEMQLNFLADGPQSLTAGAAINVDGLPDAVQTLLHTFLGQYLTWIDPNWFDPNIIWSVIDTMTGGFNFDFDFTGTLTELTADKVADPVVANLDTNGAFQNLWIAANIDSAIQFNGGSPLNLPAIPVPFTMNGQYTGTPTDAVTYTGADVDGGVTTPNIVLIDQLIELPIGPDGVNVKFRAHFQVDDGHAHFKFIPNIATTSGYLLTANASPADKGTITLNPTGPKFAPGATVTVTAAPIAGWNFSQWQGDLSGNANPATITMNTHHTITAVFVPDVTLTLNFDPNVGTITANPAGPSYPPGTVVTLTATGAPSYYFSAWTGALSGSTNPTTITMNADKTVGATFLKNQVTLTVTTEGSGSVDVTPAGPVYTVGTSVTLVPKPSIGQKFVTWEGDINAGQETANPLTLVMNQNRTVNAVFKSGLCGTGSGAALGMGMLALTAMFIRRRMR